MTRTSNSRSVGTYDERLSDRSDLRIGRMGVSNLLKTLLSPRSMNPTDPFTYVVLASRGRCRAGLQQDVRIRET